MLQLHQWRQAASFGACPPARQQQDRKKAAAVFLSSSNCVNGLLKNDSLMQTAK
jgi:hypothetical protein